MSKISEKLNIINNAKNNIKTAIETDGIEVGNVGIQEYADKINIINTNIANAYTEIENKGVVTTGAKNSGNLANVISAIQTGGGTGGGEVEKGIIINACNEYGYITDITVVGLTKLPNYYLSAKDTTSQTVINKYLQNVNLPNNLTQIGTYAFYYCNKLELESLPESIEYIGNYAFYYNSKLKLKRIPRGVTIIYGSAFDYCSGLTELTIEGDLTTINANAFGRCSNLNKIVMPNLTSVPTLSNVSAFTGTPIANNKGYIYIPDTLVTEMQGASNWSNFASQIKGVSEL